MKKPCCMFRQPCFDIDPEPDCKAGQAHENFHTSVSCQHMEINAQAVQNAAMINSNIFTGSQVMLSSKL